MMQNITCKKMQLETPLAKCLLFSPSLNMLMHIHHWPAGNKNTRSHLSAHRSISTVIYIGLYINELATGRSGTFFFLRWLMILILLPREPFYQHGLILIPAWICNHKPSKVWDEIACSFPNFNSSTGEVWGCRGNFTPHFTMDVITYQCWNLSYCLLVKGSMFSLRKCQ